MKKLAMIMAVAFTLGLAATTVSASVKDDTKKDKKETTCPKAKECTSKEKKACCNKDKKACCSEKKAEAPAKK